MFLFVLHLNNVISLNPPENTRPDTIKKRYRYMLTACNDFFTQLDQRRMILFSVVFSIKETEKDCPLFKILAINKCFTP